MNKKVFIYIKGMSDLGTMMDAMTMNVVILLLTDSPIWLSGLFAFRVLGGILSSLIAGSLVDRLNRKKIMIVSDLLRGTILAILVFFPSPCMFLMSSFLLGFFASFFQISFSSEIPNIYGKENILETNALITRITSISIVLGLFGTALFSTLVDYKVILIIDAFSFFLCAIVLYYLKWESIPKITENLLTYSMKGLLTEFVRDFKLVKSYLILHPLLSLTFVIYLIQTFGSSSHNMGIPILSTELGSENATFFQGIIWGVWAIGNFLATLILPKLNFIKNRLYYSNLYLGLLLSFSFILIFSSKQLWLILVFAFITGLFDGSAMTVISTILQKTDNSIRGRIIGVSSLLNRFGFFMGFIITPLILVKINLFQMVMLMHGIVIFVIIVSVILISFNKEMRGIETTVNS